MNDEQIPAEPEAAGPRCGERLAAARQLRKLSLEEVARELHIDEPKVQALEQNRFGSLGAPVFARGHLRKYAELMGLPVDEILAEHKELTQTDGDPPVVGAPKPRPPRELNLGPWLVGLPILLVLFGAAYWWLGRMDLEPAASAIAPPASESPRQPAAGTAQPDELLDTETADTVTPPPPTAAPAPVATEATPLAAPVTNPDNAAPVAGPAEVRLTLQYLGDCWTEVSDGNGRRLFFDLGRAGRSVTVSGPPPLNVLIGEAANVSLRVNGEPYSLADAERRGATARLTINP